MKTLKASTAKITDKRRRTTFGPGRSSYITDGFNVYLGSCPATALIDKWFNENEVYSLMFKCKTWTKLKNLATKLTIAAMRTNIVATGPGDGEKCQITYSRNAGCSCGCSPGYRIRKINRNDPQTVQYGSENLSNHDLWMDVKCDTTELEAKLPTFTEMLKKELKGRA
jgi:hypothetical protein